MVQNEVAVAPEYFLANGKTCAPWRQAKEHLRDHSNYVEHFVSSLNGCQAVHKC